MDKNPDSKIVVTSLGISSPFGYSIEDFKKHLKSNGSAKHVTNVDENKLLEAIEKFENVDPRRMDHLSLIAVMASISCFKEAGIEITEENKEDVGGIFNTVFGPVSSARDFILSGINNKNGITFASPIIFPYTVGNAASGIITILMKAIGFNTTLNSDNPVCYAFETIKNKRAKALLVGGYEEVPAEVNEAFKNRTVQVNGEKVNAKIDRLTEGSAMVFMETEEFAKERNANVLMEICGYGVRNNIQKKENSIDNFGYISPDTIYKSMSIALDKSGINKDKISTVISLSRDDSSQTDSENEALNKIWYGDTPEVLFIKKTFGESFGASDTFGLIAGYINALELKGKSSEPQYAMVNSYHIGGNCFSVIIKV